MAPVQLGDEGTLQLPRAVSSNYPFRSMYNARLTWGCRSYLACTQLVSGLFFPIFAATLGGIYVVARGLYSSGYRARGKAVVQLGKEVSYHVLFVCFPRFRSPWTSGRSRSLRTHFLCPCPDGHLRKFVHDWHLQFFPLNREC